MRWRLLVVCLSIFINVAARADEIAFTGLIESISTKSSIAQPTIVRVISLHDVPQTDELWKPVQTLSEFESIVDSHARAIGVAFAIDQNGNLATAAHVVEDSSCIWIVREDGSVLPAIVVGMDRRSDLAVIRTLDVTNPFEFASTGQVESSNLTLRTGANRIVHSIDAEFIGKNRSLPTLTRSSGRDYGNLIEFSGAARAGDSGSPIVDESGRVVGMLCAVIERADSPTSGFAIPFDSLTIDHLRRLARGEEIQHGYVGVELSNLPDENEPIVQIESIAHDSPADKVFRAGDQIKSINNEPMMSAHDVSRLIDASPDKTLSVEIVREKEPMKVDLTVRARNAQLAAISSGQFIWSNAIFPADCFDEIVTSDSIPQSIEASKLIRHDLETKPIEIWRAGEREQ